MTIHKLIAPDPDAVTVIGGAGNPRDGVRIILGVGYTDNDQIAEWAARKGYTVEAVDEIPAEHTVAVERLDAYPVQMLTSTADATDPDEKFRFNAADGHTAVDIRDVINGTITA